MDPYSKESLHIKNEAVFPHYQKIIKYAKNNLRSTLQSICHLEFSSETFKKLQKAHEIEQVSEQKTQFGETLIYFCGRKLISDLKEVGLLQKFSDSNNSIYMAIFKQVLQICHQHLQYLFHKQLAQQKQGIEFSSFDISVVQEPPIEQHISQTYYYDQNYQTWMFAFNSYKQQNKREIELDEKIRFFIKQEIGFIICLIFQKQQYQQQEEHNSNKFRQYEIENLPVNLFNENTSQENILSNNHIQVLTNLCRFYVMPEPAFTRKQIIKNQLFEVSVDMMLNQEKVSMKGQGQSWKNAKKRGCQLMISYIREKYPELWSPFVQYWHQRQSRMKDI